MCGFICKNMKTCVEVPIFLLYFCFMFSDTVTSNLIIYRTCYVTLGYNETDCALLGTNNGSKELETKVQPAASILLTVQASLATIVPAILILFIGPWIDRNGRRPVMLYALLGNFITYVVLIIICAIPSASPWWWLITSFTTSLGGGETSLSLACVCYITDITSERNRGFRMGLYEASMSIGVLLGITTSSFAFNSMGYFGNYGICAGCTLLAVLYIFFFVPESIELREETGGIKGLFDCSLVKDMYRTCVKKRENYNRAILSILLIVLVLYMMAINADSQIFFLFLRDKFHWTLETFTLYTSAYNFAGIFITILSLYILHRKLHFDEIMLIYLGLLLTMITALLYGISATNDGLYVAGLTRCFGGIVRPLLKTAISKIVPAAELGQVLTVATSLESITPLFTGPIYTLVYNKTLHTFSSAFNFITAGIHCINLFVLCSGIHIKMNKSAKNHS